MLLKICGITREEDAVCAAQAGADFIGVILVPSSKRFVTLEQASRIFVAAAPARTVLVTRDMPLTELQSAIDTLHPYAVQLHGNEQVAYATCIQRANVWKAFNLCREFDLGYASGFPAEFIIADSGGGTGTPCDWHLASELAKRHKTLLAGGINSQNAQEAASIVKPCGLDASGGVESSPGIKDSNKIKTLAEIVLRL